MADVRSGEGEYEFGPVICVITSEDLQDGTIITRYRPGNSVEPRNMSKSMSELTPSLGIHRGQRYGLLTTYSLA